MHHFPARIIRCAAIWLAGFASIVAANAQPTANPDRVTFFTEPNFKGEALTVEAGASVENLDRMTRPSQRPWMYAISSVRVEGAATAAVFSAPEFGGDRLDVSRSIPDLFAAPRGREVGATWDRAIASITVNGPQRAVVTQPRSPAPYEPPPTTVVVVPAPAPPPVVVMRQAQPRLDRRTAEMIVQRAFREVLNRPADPDGLRTYRDRLMHEGWSEQQVIQALQRSSEARGVNADEAITKAYREVLGRDPDANGLAHYRSKWRDGWTQGQIRDDLRRSNEGRDSYIRSTITRAYRELLGREPDAGGYANYERGMRERGWTEREVRQAIMSGDEYRQKHARK
jgi:hypothetical protein